MLNGRHVRQAKGYRDTERVRASDTSHSDNGLYETYARKKEREKQPVINSGYPPKIIERQ